MQSVNRKVHPVSGLLVGLVLSAGTAGAVAAQEAQSLDKLSAELVEIRQEIESLHDEISREKTAFQDQMRSYSSQKSDLEVRISRADLNIKDLQRELEEITAEKAEANQASESVTPVLKGAIADLRETVSASLPFKLGERMAALDEIEHRLDAQVVTPNKAANQLWAFVEDELMLGKSSGIYKDTLTVDGQEKLVEVLRLGKVAMFYRTPDGTHGLVRKNGGQWKKETISQPEKVARVEQLFDAFNKNIHRGQFTTPNFLPKN